MVSPSSENRLLWVVANHFIEKNTNETGKWTLNVQRASNIQINWFYHHCAYVKKKNQTKSCALVNESYPILDLVCTRRHRILFENFISSFSVTTSRKLNMTKIQKPESYRHQTIQPNSQTHQSNVSERVNNMNSTTNQSARSQRYAVCDKWSTIFRHYQHDRFNE